MQSRVSEKQARELFKTNGFLPLEPFPGTQKPWKSRCLKTKKMVSPTYGKVRDYGHRCGYCSGRKVEPEEAIALMKVNGLIPLVSYPGSNTPWKSRCSVCKKVTSPTYSNVKKGIGCKFCGSRAVDSKDAIEALKLRGFKPLEPYPGNTKPWKVQCFKAKHSYSIKLHSLNRKSICKFCAKTEIHPDEMNKVLERLKLSPLEPFPGAKQAWKLRCKRCNRIVSPSWTHLTRNDRNVGGCSYCSKRKLDMSEVALLLKRKGLKPLGEFVNVRTPWLCECTKCRNVVSPTVSGLKTNKSGCVYCAGVMVEERKALDVAKRNGFIPMVPYPGANVGWECSCVVCGKVSKPRYTSMQQGENRCKYCATGGFDFNKPAIIYLITNTELKAHKIGVAGASSNNERLAKHKKGGWSLYRSVKFANGAEAFEVETRMLRWIKVNRGLLPAVDISDMPQGGWSETFSAEAISLAEVWKKTLMVKKSL